MARDKKTGNKLHHRSLIEQITDWQCIVLLAVLLIIFFYKHFLGIAYLWEDFLYFNYPVRSFAATSMSAGEMPLWNPYTLNGMPFLADIQTTVFYFPLTLLVLFVSNGVLNSYWLQSVLLLHYVLAGGSMFFLARSFSLRKTAAILAGAAYMFSGFMIVHAIHQQIITLVAWYPLIFLGFKKVMDEGSWKWVFVTAVVLGHSILAGYPQLSLYFYTLLFAYTVFEILSRYGIRNLLTRPALTRAGQAALIVALSVGLAMIQLLPTLELSGLSQRAEITYARSSEGSLAWSQVLTLLFPKIFGSAGAQSYAYFGPGTYWYFWETCIYLGILPLMLLLMSARKIREQRIVAFLWGVVIFVLLYALGSNFPLHRFLYEFMPGFSTFRNPARMAILLTFASSLLAGMAFQWMEDGKFPSSFPKRLVYVVAGIGVSVWLLTLLGAVPSVLDVGRDAKILSAMNKETGISCAIIVLTGALLMAAIARPRKTTGLMLLGVFFVDMLVFGFSQNTGTVNPMEYFNRNSQLVDFFRKQYQTDMFRINTRNSQGMIMDRNQGMVSRVQMMEGYTPLALQRFIPPVGSDERLYDLLNVKYKTVTDQQARALRIVPHENPLPRAFFVYDVRVISEDERLKEFLKSDEFHHRTQAVIEKDPGWRLDGAPDSVAWMASVVAYHNNEIRLAVETPREGFLVLSEIFFPGWKAYVDGAEEEIFRTDYDLRGIRVREGSHAVEFRFASSSYGTGRLVTLATMLLCAAGIVISGRKKQTRQAGEAASKPGR